MIKLFLCIITSCWENCCGRTAGISVGELLAFLSMKHNYFNEL